LKSIGVKFKVFVKDRDLAYHDDIDEFVQLLQLTPDLNIAIANWTTIVMYGMRSIHKTR